MCLLLQLCGGTVVANCTCQWFSVCALGKSLWDGRRGYHVFWRAYKSHLKRDTRAQKIRNKLQKLQYRGVALCSVERKGFRLLVFSLVVALTLFDCRGGSKRIIGFCLYSSLAREWSFPFTRQVSVWLSGGTFGSIFQVHLALRHVYNDWMIFIHYREHFVLLKLSFESS
jgi:hypothetical protein